MAVEIFKGYSFVALRPTVRRFYSDLCNINGLFFEIFANRFKVQLVCGRGAIRFKQYVFVKQSVDLIVVAIAVEIQDIVKISRQHIINADELLSFAFDENNAVKTLGKEPFCQRAFRNSLAYFYV